MTTIGIYADWDGLAEPQKLGLLHSRKTRASERFEFQYASAALAAPEFANVQIDPAIGCFDGPQYPAPPRETFGAFADFSSIVGQWRTLATRLALPAREQERMAGAFHLASA